MSPSITFIIGVFKEDSGNLDKTIESIANCTYNSKYIAIIADAVNIEKLSLALNKDQKPIEAPKVFNKFPLGVPSIGIGYSKGKIRLFQGLNSLLKETYEDSDVYAFISSGDEIRQDFCNQIISSIDESPNVIGIIYNDSYRDGIRYFEESFIKEKLDKHWKLLNYCIPKYVFDKNGFFPEEDNCQNKFLLKVLEQYMAVHIPEPIISHE